MILRADFLLERASKMRGRTKDPKGRPHEYKAESERGLYGQVLKACLTFAQVENLSVIPTRFRGAFKASGTCLKDGFLDPVQSLGPEQIEPAITQQSIGTTHHYHVRWNAPMA